MRSGHGNRRRRAGFAAAVAAALAASSSCARAPAPRPTPPNVVIVLLDAVRADHLPFYGYPRDTAPFLSSLAARGVVFERAYSASGWTSPATASLFTSLYPFQHGVIWNIRRMRESQFRFSRVPEDAETIAEALHKAGYATYAVSDNVSASALGGFDAGFDRFQGGSDASSSAVNRQVKAWRSELESGRPYFLYLHYMDAHEPYIPQRGFDAFMNDGLMPNPRRDFMAAYDSEIRQLDEKVRGLFEQFHWGTNTIVIVTSDHGEGFHDHGLVGHANSLYNELLRVPLLVFSSAGAFPVPAARIATPVGHVDVLPTLREIAGLPPDPRNVGWSLVPLLREGRWTRGERPLLAHLMEFDEGHQWKAVVRGKWKLVDRIPGRPELFDLDADFAEQHDLSAQHPAEVAELRAVYARTEAAAPRFTDAARNTELTPEAIEKLRALGYVR